MSKCRKCPVMMLLLKVLVATLLHTRRTPCHVKVSHKIPRDKKQPFTLSEFNQFHYRRELPRVVTTHNLIDGLTVNKFRLATRNNVSLPGEKA
jgi:hypothetical protein